MDIGNTRASLGCFDGGVMSFRKDVQTEAVSGTVSEISTENVDLCVISCVSSKTSFILDEMRRSLKCPVKEVRVKDAPLKIHYERVESVGQDRIVNALGASLYSKTGAIVVDLGTATHFDIVDPKGEFWGGPILSGVETMLQGLVQRIPHLPEPSLLGALEPVSQSTEGAIRTGTILCAAGGIERILFEIRKQLDYSPMTLLTGGNANLVEPYIAYDRWVPNLTLEGISEYGVRLISGARRISA